jgi:tetratricopeptide (TPR) repeat protein
MDAAEKAVGPERARLLDQLLGASAKLAMYGGKIPPEKIAAWQKEIPELDADNKAGLKVKYEFDNLVREATKFAGQGKFDELQATLDKALALPGITAVQIQHGLTLKGNFYLNVNDFEKGAECIKKAMAADPQGRWIPLDKMLMERAEKKEKTDPGKHST